MDTRHRRTRFPILVLLAVTLPITASCGDAVSPAVAQSSELAEIQAQLDAVLEAVHELEAEQSQALERIDERFAALAPAARGARQGGGPPSGPSASVDGSLCATIKLDAKAVAKSLFKVRGGGDGMLGVDAYGNGATATLTGEVVTLASMDVTPTAEVALQVCGKVSGGQTALADGVTIDAGDPVVQLLEQLTSTVGTSQLATTASTVGMDGSGAAQALDLLANLSPSGLASSISGGGSVLAGLPAPPAFRSRFEDPTSVLGEARSIGTSAVDFLCDDRLWVGPFTSAMDWGCDLRHDVPAPAEVIDIISSLDGIGLALDDLDSSVSTLCGTVGDITGQDLVIPEKTIEIANKTYTTFPRYETELFPNISSPTC